MLLYFCPNIFRWWEVSTHSLITQKKQPRTQDNWSKQIAPHTATAAHIHKLFIHRNTYMCEHIHIMQPRFREQRKRAVSTWAFSHNAVMYAYVHTYDKFVYKGNSTVQIQRFNLTCTTVSYIDKYIIQIHRHRCLHTRIHSRNLQLVTEPIRRIAKAFQRCLHAPIYTRNAGMSVPTVSCRASVSIRSMLANVNIPSAYPLTLTKKNEHEGEARNACILAGIALLHGYAVKSVQKIQVRSVSAKELGMQRMFSQEHTMWCWGMHSVSSNNRLVSKHAHVDNMSRLSTGQLQPQHNGRHYGTTLLDSNIWEYPTTIETNKFQWIVDTCIGRRTWFLTK